MLEDTESNQAAVHRPRHEEGTVPVRTAHGVLLVGTPVRSDTVLVYAGGLELPLTLTVDGCPVQATALHETTTSRILDAWHPLTAIELPEGTLTLAEPRVPAELEHLFATDPGRDGARTPFWCFVFPRMRGC